MFGMLDYRASKLYWLLFFIPLFVYYIINIIGVPIIVYLVCIHYIEDFILQLIAAIPILFVVEIILAIFSFIMQKIINVIFTTIIDVVPHDGRTKQEAQFVVYRGQKALNQLALDKKNPREWTDEEIENFSKNTFFTLFFQDKVRDRCELLRDFYKENFQEDFNQFAGEKILKERNLKPTTFEQLFSGDGTGFWWLLRYGILILLFLLSLSNYI